ncbi:histidine phosphatase family protein [Streptomyces sp. RM72]|jgi:probable phosphoglycerate mutase|uniref:histidine phosphatase family protein n=1 Tax=unclassified Streptomyces TaxID=2593676 RepID=UPI000978FF92|nr:MULTISPECIES: histidine phosphatase family protein [unclassified Streptomyces]MBQ0888310.1 histidine phosphatase family protein [Streptomyces sp. RM72]OMI85201.1 histidine phosphatase family protein [Streptomyces sp. M1013]
MRLLLIRHGQTPSNLKHLLDTAEPGPGLTALGQEQAAALPDALASEKIDALYASTLVRTQLTAAPLASATGLEVRVRAGIRELTAGDLEMRGDDDAARIYMHTAFAWSAGDVRPRMPGGENGVEALARFDAVVAEAHATGAQTVALVSHGAAIRMWVAARADNVDVDYAKQHPLANTGIVILSGSPEQGWRALLWEGESLGPVPLTPGPDDPTGATVEQLSRGE